MKYIDLRNINDSSEPRMFKFPDGELHVEFHKEIDRKEYYIVISRVTSADELFILMQVADVLNRNEVEWDLHITYLMGMRMDRVMSFTRPFTLKVVSTIVRNFGVNNIYIHDPHSSISTHLMGAQQILDDVHNDAYKTVVNPLVCYPDHGAFNKYYVLFEYVDAISFEKSRDTSTGKITCLHCDDIDKANGRNVIVVDDLIDGGATAVGIAEELRKNNPKSITFSATHAVNENGLRRVAEAYDNVFVSDSYRDWGSLCIDNIHVIKLA